MSALQLNDLLLDAGIALPTARLMRHQQALENGLTPYYLWRDYPEDFYFYQSTQGENKRARLKGAKHWVSFVATPSGSTLLVGVYDISFKGVLDYDVDFKSDRTRKIAGSCDEYITLKTSLLKSYVGRLTIDWGPGARSWIQYPVRKPKLISGLAEKSYAEMFPGYLQFQIRLSEVSTLPADWKALLRAVGGVYLLTCARTREQYVGSAYGENGFLGRWETHAAHGGDAIKLQSRERSDYCVSILEVAGTALQTDDIIAAEALWKRKLQSREMGLNSN